MIALLYFRICDYGCIDSTKVAGKIVLCRKYYGIYESFGVGAVGAIALHGSRTDVSYVDAFPASALSDEDIDVVASYFNSTRYICTSPSFQ